MENGDNGLLFNSYFLPKEVVTHILSFLDAKTLVFSGRIVCKVWKMIIENEVWKLKTRTSQKHSFSKLTPTERKLLRLPWYVYFAIYDKDPFEVNLLRNTCGEKKLEYWSVTHPSGEHGNLVEANWQVEPIPTFADKLPKCEDFGSNISCFSTSYVPCEKFQRINLQKCGVIGKIMDEIRPTITVSEWYAGRYDCGCQYQMYIRFLNEKLETIYTSEKQKRTRRQWEGTEWNKVSFTIEDYPSKVRYIDFIHCGKDSQYWAGNYGSKMAGAIVKMSLPVKISSDFVLK